MMTNSFLFLGERDVAEEGADEGQIAQDRILLSGTAGGVLSQTTDDQRLAIFQFQRGADRLRSQDRGDDTGLVGVAGLDRVLSRDGQADAAIAQHHGQEGHDGTGGTELNAGTTAATRTD